jgi:uncharacterized protein
MKAFLYGAPIGVLGGLIGLGGAEFRLPVLTGVFRYSAKQAVPLNLAISLVTVAVAFVARAVTASMHDLYPIMPLVCMLTIGSILGAYRGSKYLHQWHDPWVERAVMALLILIGLLLILESFLVFEAKQVFMNHTLNLFLGVVFGFGIGIISSLLGVAGGEVIIPTLVLMFGVDIKDAGTASLLISLPTITVGLLQYWRQGSYDAAREIREVVVPMSAGSALGAVVGAVMLGLVHAEDLKFALGLLLIASAVKVFGRTAKKALMTPESGEVH